MTDAILTDDLYLSTLLLVAYSLEVGARLPADLSGFRDDLRETTTDALLHVAEGLAWSPELASAAFRNALGAVYRVGAVLDILRMTDAIKTTEHQRGMLRLEPIVIGLKKRALFP